MSEQPKEYIITDEQLHNLVHGNVQLCLVMEKEIRSRPHPAPAPIERQPCKYVAGEFCDHCIVSTCKFYPFDKQHDAAIRAAIRAAIARQAREDVLKKFNKALLASGYKKNHDAGCKTMILDTVGGGCYPATLLEHNLIKTIESLRGERR